MQSNHIYSHMYISDVFLIKYALAVSSAPLHRRTPSSLKTITNTNPTLGCLSDHLIVRRHTSSQLLLQHASIDVRDLLFAILALRLVIIILHGRLLGGLTRLALAQTGSRRSNQRHVLLHVAHVHFDLHLAALAQALHDKVAGATLLDGVDALDGVDGLRPQLAVVLERCAATLLKVQRRIDGQLLAGRLAERLRPAGLARVLALLERLVAFRAAEPEDLCEANGMRFGGLRLC